MSCRYVNCEFGTHLQDSLRDRLLCGLYNTHIQKKLLTEDKLTFEKSVDISTAMETAAKDALELQNKAHVASGSTRSTVVGNRIVNNVPNLNVTVFVVTREVMIQRTVTLRTKSAEIASVKVTLRERAKRHRPIIGTVEVRREKRTM